MVKQKRKNGNGGVGGGLGEDCAQRGLKSQSGHHGGFVQDGVRLADPLANTED